MKKLLTFLITLTFVMSLTGCMFGPDKKIFINDLNSAFSDIKNPNSTGAQSSINSLYESLTSVCYDLNNTQKASLKDKCKQLYISFFSNAKCDNITVNVSGSTANVDSSVTINDIKVMKDDMQSQIEKTSNSIRKMNRSELKAFFGNTDVTKLSKSQATYYILNKSLNNVLASFKKKNYAKTLNLKVVYTKTDNTWNISEDSKKKINALLVP